MLSPLLFLLHLVSSQVKIFKWVETYSCFTLWKFLQTIKTSPTSKNHEDCPKDKPNGSSSSRTSIWHTMPFLVYTWPPQMPYLIRAIWISPRTTQTSTFSPPMHLNNKDYQCSPGRQNQGLLLQQPTSSSSCPSDGKRTSPLQQTESWWLDLQRWTTLLQSLALCPQTSSPQSGCCCPQFLWRQPWESSLHHHPSFQGLLVAWPFHLHPEIHFCMHSLPGTQGPHPSYSPSHHPPCLQGLLSLPKPLHGPHHWPSPSQWPWFCHGCGQPWP